MLSAKYTEKSFDALVNKRCKEHQLQKLHSRIGTSHLPIAQESIFPQTARPPASGKEGEKSKSVKILNIRESPLYTGGLMTGKEPISAMNINFNVPLYFQMKATNIIPKKKSSSIETSTEDLFWKVAKGSQVKPDMIETGTAPNEELVYQNIQEENENNIFIPKKVLKSLGLSIGFQNGEFATPEDKTIHQKYIYLNRKYPHLAFIFL